MSIVEEKIIAHVQILPPDKQAKVLAFVERLIPASPQRLRSLVRMDEIVQAVPLEEWQELPADGAANVDHYLYGSEKQA